MGGSAFASRKIHTPRMPPATYHKLKRKHHDILTGLFSHVTTPPEAPGKPSYGDLDFLVAGPLPANPIHPQNGSVKQKDGKNTKQSSPETEVTTMEHVKLAFGTDISIKLSDTTSFAVPREASSSDEENVGEMVYVQVDVHVCESPELVEWMSFKHAYGDMWSILGMVARAKGLVADETCLNVMIEEIEARDKKLSKVELTRDVHETLRFFGLDIETYEKGFETMEEVYGFIKSSRFFEIKYFRDRAWSKAADRRKQVKREMMREFFEWLGVLREEEEEQGEQKEGEEGLASVEDGLASVEDEKIIEKKEDSKENEEEKPEVTLEGKIEENIEGREKTEHENEDKSDTAEEEETITREQVLQEALDRFGKRTIYDEKVTRWRREEKINGIAGSVTKSLLDGEYCSIKSARKRGSNLRRRLVAGELEEVMNMQDDELRTYLANHVEELVRDIKAQMTGGVLESASDSKVSVAKQVFELKGEDIERELEKLMIAEVEKVVDA